MSQENQDDIAAAWEAELAAEENAKKKEGASGIDEAALAAEWEAMAAADEDREPATFGSAASGAGTNASGGSFGSHAIDAQFTDMTEMSKQPRDKDLKRELDFILDIPLDVSAELGRTRLLINELLQLGQGSVVELNKLAGEPLEVYVNGKLVARGEAVVINEKFGVRLTDIISPIERVKQLG